MKESDQETEKPKHTINIKRQILLPLLILLFLLGGTTAVVLYARGYRFGFERGTPRLAGTGLLVATSIPDGAAVSINGHLTTATDNTINLAPGEYTVEISKEGYFPWKKKLKVQEEVVAKADALLFPTSPKLESITATGVQDPIIDPSYTKLAYTASSQSAHRKNGVYILDMNSRPILTLTSAATQIASDEVDLFSSSVLSWSPDGQNLLASIPSTDPTTPTRYLLDTSGMNNNPQDITATLDSTQAVWNEEKVAKELARIQTLKSSLKQLISKNFRIIAWSPDETRILYQASESASLPLIIKPRIIGADTTPEDRNIKQGFIYVYDIKEDKNFKIEIAPSILENSKTSPIMWFPDSKRLIYVHDKKIDILEYDGTNQTTIYAGPFIDHYVFPWPNGSKIVVLTNLGNENTPPNLYTISLK